MTNWYMSYIYIIVSKKISGIDFFFWYYILDWIKDNALKSLGECIALLWSIETVDYFCYCCVCLNKMFSVLQEIYVRRILMNNILLILCFCFVLNCSSFQCIFCKCTTSFVCVPCVVHKTKMPLTVLYCHTILIENVCRLLSKSLLPTMFIKMCIKLKDIHLASYLGVEKLSSKVNAALW